MICDANDADKVVGDDPILIKQSNWTTFEVIKTSNDLFQAKRLKNVLNFSIN